MKKWLAVILLFAMTASAAMAEDLLDRQIAQLRSLGLEISDEAEEYVRSSADAFWEKLPEEIQKMYGGKEDYFDLTSILSTLGFGRYDFESDAFEPLTDDIFGFDAEMWDIPGDYLALLEAVARLSGGEVTVSDWEYQVDERALMRGAGEMRLTFSLNGVPCIFDAELMDDWMDCRIIDCVNEYLEAAEIPNRVWCMFDGGQGYILFYNDSDWARRFEDVTGCALDLHPE